MSLIQNIEIQIIVNKAILKPKATQIFQFNL